MQECSRRKAPIVQLADRVAGYFTVGALLLFVVTLGIWYFKDAAHAVDHAVSLLIVSCPCGLGLATPFAVSVALGRAARASILVKGGEVLEKLSVRGGRQPTVFLDKTGTLTEPGLSIIEWHGAPDVAARLGPAVAAIEAQIAHPIARALASADTTLRAESIRSSPGGVAGLVDGQRYLIGSERFVMSKLEAQPGTAAQPPHWAAQAKASVTVRGNTAVWVAVDGAIAAVIGVGSRLRADAKSTVASLRASGFKVVILSGDDSTTVAAVGSDLGLLPEDCRGELTPEAKLDIVQQTMQTEPAFMVGDGINDAAALSAASVGVAVHGGAEASLVAADAYLGRAGIGVVVELLAGARRTLAVIRRCLLVSLGYNVVAAALAMTGAINALIAALLMPLASFTVLGIALGSKTFGSNAGD
jgi:Cu2+-exporting ATPase